MDFTIFPVDYDMHDAPGFYALLARNAKGAAAEKRKHCAEKSYATEWGMHAERGAMRRASVVRDHVTLQRECGGKLRARRHQIRRAAIARDIDLGRAVRNEL